MDGRVSVEQRSGREDPRDGLPDANRKIAVRGQRLRRRQRRADAVRHTICMIDEDGVGVRTARVNAECDVHRTPHSIG